MFDDLIKRLENGPAVFFVGQKYLSIETGTDIFLKKTLEKYGNFEPNSDAYKAILKLNLSSEADSALSWMFNLCKSISTPEWLEKVACIPWSSIYTTSYDTILERAFENEWRSIQPVTNEKFRVIDPRNKINLHITYLNGNISETEIAKRPPLSNPESIRRKSTVNSLMDRLPEIVTPKGVLIIDGYGLNDQLSIEDLSAAIYQLGPSQVLLCNATELKTNDIIASLIEDGKLLIYEKGFAELFSEWQLENKIKILAPTEYDYYGKWLTLPEKKLNIPQQIISTLYKTATILDDDIFDRPDNGTSDTIEDFRRFLSSSNASPSWFGYPLEFAFKRDYYDILKKNVSARIKSNELKETPVILYGQSSSGKTTSLGLLAYEIRNEFKYPVLYIEKRYQKVDEREIDSFCKWVEDNGGKNTIIIWDGMQEPEIYNSFLRKLNTRGRNVILVGSCYTTSQTIAVSDNYNVIESPINLSTTEKKRFSNFLRNIEPIISNILSGLNDNNFLAMLYRYIPATRPGINKGLVSELDFFSKLLANQTLTSDSYNKGQLYDALKNAGVLNAAALFDLNQTTEIDNEIMSRADQLIFSIMVPGKFGLNVPFELLLRIIGYDAFSSSLFKALNEINIIEWYEYAQGEFQLGARTAIEAKILSNYLGRKDTEVEFIKLLIQNIRPNQMSFIGESDYQIQFAVELLNKVGPNSEDKSYERYLYDFADELRILREGNFAYHPRLILKEAFFLREIAKKKIPDLTETNFEILDRAEFIVREALDILSDYPERSIKVYLKVELAAILGTKAYQYAENGNLLLAKQSFQTIKETISNSFISNPENFNALDIIAWSTMDLIRFNVFNDIEKLEAEVELANLIEIVEVEGVSDQKLEDFNKMKLKFYSLIEKKQLADETFELLRKKGFASGYYIRAKAILGFSQSLDDQYHEKNAAAFTYLNENYNQIKNDSKCLFLLFKCWWVSKTKSAFFFTEKQTLPLTQDDWNYCLNILNRLVALETNFSTTVYYIKAIAEFHLGLYPESWTTFGILDAETNFSFYGRRRIAKTYLSSNPDGSPKVYSGRVKRAVSYAAQEKRGEIEVLEIRRTIPFLLYDFHKGNFQEGERINAINIAFNFRGPIAIEPKN